MNKATVEKNSEPHGDLSQIDICDPSLYENDCWQPIFARLREEDPVHYVAESSYGPFWSVTTHDLIMEVDTNHKVYSSEVGGIALFDFKGDHHKKLENFISMDEPRHGQQRKSVSPAFEPKNLQNLEPLIRQRAANILDHLPIGETFDWVDKVSVELTSRMLATLLDFPYEQRRKLVHWSDIATELPELTGHDVDMERRQRELGECAGAFLELWNQRVHAEPKFDLISMLAHGDATKDMAENPALFIGTVLMLIVGGNDTTRNSISGGVIALNHFPDEYEKLRSNLGFIPNMAAEIIRWQTPAIHMRRTALQDTELGGKTVRKGDKVVMWYLSGNRDETVFPNAERLIIDRPNARQHLSFGFGIHRCMGNRLAEMQLRILWEEIMKRFRMVEVVGEVDRLANNAVRGIVHLPVQVHPI